MLGVVSLDDGVDVAEATVLLEVSLDDGVDVEEDEDCDVAGGDCDVLANNKEFSVVAASFPESPPKSSLSSSSSNTPFVVPERFDSIFGSIV